ncbi:YihY/virulence factor BrkB family protein [Actinoplanes sp. LDG1-06]|uniref:YihY/virulence factor BrkB family protein n=1 Tax=Paractinoplanes ovalisporus TaxID=2810368 RepID=A0ABS2APP5_9ACTN|nr:YihY/virulence factor BrkB family protein [Actinoplanes ovalisporus]MBM2621789.1 YihY/virulence factor BrkB family protein [Actinoplanes ovalisporus]
MKLLRRKHDEDDQKAAAGQTAAGERPAPDPESAGARARGAKDYDLEAARTTRTPGDKPKDVDAVSPDEGPDSPMELRGKGLFAALKRTFKQFSEDNVSDWAAALTYYGVLSIFPGAVVLVSILGMLSNDGQATVQQTVSEIANNDQIEELVGTVLNQVKGTGGAGFAAIIGLVLAFWSASGYVAAFMRASNSVYDVPEGRPIWKTLPIRVGVTAVIGLMLIVSAFIVIFTGDLARVVGERIGLGDAAVLTWNIAKWPVLVLLVSLMFAILYWASPNAKTGGFRWVSPGGIFAVLLWLVASGGFAIYLGNFANYDKTYGTLGGVIAFLVWLWISNIAILLGAELDAELERGRAIAAGHDPSEEPFLELRDDRKLKKGSEHGLSSG